MFLLCFVVLFILLSFVHCRSHLDSGLTIFTIVPPATDGGVPTSQYNAVCSWAQLDPPPEILVFGNEVGARELAEACGAQHIEETGPRDPETRLPMLNELFARAEQVADPTHDVLMYSNSDIVFTQELMDAVELARETFPDPTHQFLMVGKRYDLRVDQRLEFPVAGRVPVPSVDAWDTRLRRQVASVVDREQHDQLRWALDYFAWSRGFWGPDPSQSLLPLVMGVPVFDNWLVHQANVRAKAATVQTGTVPGAAVIDCSLFVPAVHQRHVNKWRSADRQRAKLANEGLAVRWHFGNTDHAGYVIEPCDHNIKPLHWGFPPKPCLESRAYKEKLAQEAKTEL